MNSPANDYIKAADEIGRRLVRDAIWDDDRCFWFVQTETAGNFGPQISVTACSHDLADGFAGIECFLKKLFSIHGDPMTAMVIAGLQRSLHLALCDDAKAELTAPDQTTRLRACWEHRSSSDPCEDPPSVRLNQFVSACLSGAVEKLQPWSPTAIADEALQHAEANPGRLACFADPILAESFLVAAEITDDPRWLDAATRIADSILIKTDQYGQPWRGDIGREFPPLGLRDGIAGIGHFLVLLGTTQPAA